MNWYQDKLWWRFFKGGQQIVSCYCDLDEADQHGLKIKADYWGLVDQEKVFEIGASMTTRPDPDFQWLLNRLEMDLTDLHKGLSASHDSPFKLALSDDPAQVAVRERVLTFSRLLKEHLKQLQ
jgi:hypothetical protein